MTGYTQSREGIWQIAYDEYRVTEIVSQLPNRKRGYRKEKRNGKGQEISRAYYSNG